MKKIVICIGILMFSSCNRMIELVPISQHSTANFYNNETELDQALTAAYNSIRSTHQYGGNGYSSFMEVTSDNTWNTNTTMAGGAYASFDNFTLTSNNIQISNTWVSCFDTVQRSNIVISRLKNSENISEEFKNKKMSEALFLRALTYFNMVRIWGGVPLITAEITDVNEAFQHTRATEEKVYAQIVEDLEFAVKHLPVQYESNDIGRVTNGAAKTLLAKVFLTQKNWAKAKTLLDEVVNSNQYKLVSDFSKVFSVDNKNNEESIFEVQFSKTLEGQGYMGGNPLILGQDVNNLPSDNLLALFDDNLDDRKNASVVKLDNLGWRMSKWQDTFGSNGGLDFNIIVLRFADVLLMNAEVQNELAYGTPQALDYLNQVRERSNARLYSYTELNTQEKFRNAIEKERRLELAFENHRWFDLVRIGKAIETMNNSRGASVFPISISAKNLLFPIPQSQIDASGGKLAQNPL
ncbi:MAG: RagB/SusD family nutrient uptake outer membrane protein [Cruoricaptor ignavus]|nr:RagB/SusD family nutrient uptake outer membrane protein [Cruoricaptor ignavus]